MKTKILGILIALEVFAMPNLIVYMSADTISTLAAERESKAAFYATKYGLELALVRSFMVGEGQDYKFSLRDDTRVLSNQQWVKDALAKNPGLFFKYGHTLFQSAGYMQMLLIVAILDYGFQGTIEDFLKIDNQLDFACHHVRRLLDRFKGNLKDAIAAYNQGWNGWNDLDRDGIHDANESYYNQPYVDKIYAEYKRRGGKR